MAASNLTVTPPNPTPPTNMSCTGATSPNPPNFSKNLYIDYADNTIINTAGNVPYFDDGAAGPVGTFATNTAALTQGVGSGATAGGTEGSYPGAANGVVPAATSVPHEGAGTEVVVTNPGNLIHTYPILPSGTVTFDTSKSYSAGPAVPTPTPSVPLPSLISVNSTHPSSLSPTTNPTLASLTPATAAKGAGTQGLTVTGTGFVPGCRIWVNNQERPTTFISATSMSTTFNKSPDAGIWKVDVKLGGVAVPSTRDFTWT